ncbi:MAG: hypothetical protein ACI9WS_000347 [Paraglaciecola psychrophila]|jgi:hypothetical protein
MHIPKFEVTPVGAEVTGSKVFGLIAAAGIQQEWVEIHEYGLYVTCFLHQTDGTDGGDVVEIVLFDEQDRVVKIWALKNDIIKF